MNQIKPAFAPGKGAARFVAVFGRKPGHACVRNVGRVAHNQVIAVATERLEQIRPDQLDPMLQAVLRNIAACNG
jgi:hypothetical protein